MTMRATARTLRTAGRVTIDSWVSASTGTELPLEPGTDELYPSPGAQIFPLTKGPLMSLTLKVARLGSTRQPLRDKEPMLVRPPTRKATDGRPGC